MSITITIFDNKETILKKFRDIPNTAITSIEYKIGDDNTRLAGIVTQTTINFLDIE